MVERSSRENIELQFEIMAAELKHCKFNINHGWVWEGKSSLSRFKK